MFYYLFYCILRFHSIHNYLSKADVFLGGNIAPGMEIRFRALHLYTDKLPYAIFYFSASGKKNTNRLTLPNIFFQQPKHLFPLITGLHPFPLPEKSIF